MAKQSQPLCVGCGYPLARLKAPICPECGKPFDARNPDTWASGPFAVRVKRFFFGPIRFFHWGLLFAAVLTTLYANVPPGHYNWALGLGTLLWVAVLAILIATAPSSLPSKSVRSSRNRAYTYCGLVVIMLLACVSLARSDAGVRLHFAFFRGEFESLGRLADKTPGGWGVSARIGLLELRSSTRSFDGLTPFKAAGDSEDHARYLLYVPDGARQRFESWRPPGLDVHGLSGNWYLMKDDRNPH